MNGGFEREHVESYSLATKLNYISTATITITTKFGRLLIYHEGYAPIKLYEHLITWSSEITWQTETIISPLPQCLWPQKLEGWGLS